MIRVEQRVNGQVLVLHPMPGDEYHPVGDEMLAARLRLAVLHARIGVLSEERAGVYAAVVTGDGGEVAEITGEDEAVVRLTVLLLHEVRRHCQDPAVWRVHEPEVQARAVRRLAGGPRGAG